MKNWYTYLITFEDGFFYYGYRGTKKNPTDDFLINYFSSSKLVKEKIKTEKYKGEILLTSINQQTVYDYEQKLISENIEHPKCLNQTCYFKREGFGVLSENVKTKLGKKSKERWSNPEYRQMMIDKQTAAWDDKRKKEYSNYMSSQWTNERKKEHSKKLRGRQHTEEQLIKMRKPKHSGHGAKVSASTKNVPKSKSHKESLSIAAKNRKKILCVCGKEYLPCHKRYHKNC